MALFSKKNNNNNNDKEKNTPAEKSTPATESAATPAATPATESAPIKPTTAPNVTMAAPANPAQPKYQTPEGFDFNRYFLAERRIVLENVSYETQRPAQTQGQLKLGVKDTILAQLVGQAGVKVTYNRTLRFDPEGPFTLSVSFGVMLVFNPGTRGEIDWTKIDVAEEFKKNCPALVQAMMAKAALLVAEITAANGGAPIIPLK